MMRTRLVWFGIGFSVAGASIAQFVWRDLSSDRIALSKEVKHNFDALEARLTMLESLKFKKTESTQDET